MCVPAFSCVQVSWGSYHAITQMMPFLAARYPLMCFSFLAGLDHVPLGECNGVVLLRLHREMAVDYLQVNKKN